MIFSTSNQLTLQKFKVVILSKLSAHEVRLVPDEDQTQSVINTESFENKQEWRLYSHVSLDAEDEDELPKKINPLSRQFQNQPQLLATSIASRRSEFYVMNFMFTTVGDIITMFALTFICLLKEECIIGSNY